MHMTLHWISNELFAIAKHSDRNFKVNQTDLLQPSVVTDLLLLTS